MNVKPPYQIWLLHRGSTEAADQQVAVDLNLLRPLYSVPDFLWPIWRWFLLFFSLKRTLPLLDASCLSKSQSLALAAELNRLLGPQFKCFSLSLFREGDLESLCSETQKNSTIFLVPLFLSRSTTLHHLMEQTRAALYKMRCRLIEAPLLSVEDSLAESFAQQIRAHRLKLDKNLTYKILFLLPIQLDYPKQAQPEYLSPYRVLAQQIQSKLHHSIKYEIHTLEHSSLKPAVEHFEGTWITVGLGWFYDHREFNAQVSKLRQNTSSTYSIVPSISQDSLFHHLLIEHIKNQIPAHPQPNNEGQA